VDRNFHVEPIQRVDAETLGSWKNLARHVRDDLAAAGIPVKGIQMPEGDRGWVWEEASSASDAAAAGAEIDIDPEKFPGTRVDEASIWVSWRPREELRNLASETLLEGYEKAKLHPAMVQFGKEIADMRDAMLSILEAAGYRVMLSNDDLRPYELRVLSGPARISPN
jgi:hypothetical protein